MQIFVSVCKLPASVLCFTLLYGISCTLYIKPTQPRSFAAACLEVGRAKRRAPQRAGAFGQIFSVDFLWTDKSTPDLVVLRFGENWNLRVDAIRSLVEARADVFFDDIQLAHCFIIWLEREV